MSELKLVESIKVKNGLFYNLPAHLERMHRTAIHFFGEAPSFSPHPEMIPEDLRDSFLKCRILYNREILSVEFQPYTFRRVESLVLVEDNKADYSWKYEDRENLNRLYAGRGEADDILILKNGKVTDTFSANIVLENEYGFFTPDTYLLNGTKRQQLLREGRVQEVPVRAEDLSRYHTLYLINAMIDLEDGIKTTTANIRCIG